NPVSAGNFFVPVRQAGKPLAIVATPRCLEKMVLRQDGAELLGIGEGSNRDSQGDGDPNRNAVLDIGGIGCQVEAWPRFAKIGVGGRHILYRWAQDHK